METSIERASQASPKDAGIGPSDPARGGKEAGNPAMPGGLWNRLLALTARSLPAYLFRTRPWVSGRYAELWDAMQEIAGEHREFAAKLAQQIVRRGGVPNPGNYPGVYTAWHDLSLEFLAERVIRELRRGATDLEAVGGGAGSDAALSKAAESLRRLFLDEAERLQTLLDDVRKEAPAPPDGAA